MEEFIVIVTLLFVTLITVSVIISEIILKHERRNRLGRQDELEVILNADYNYFTGVDYSDLSDYINSDTIVTQEKFQTLFTDEMSKKLK